MMQVVDRQQTGLDLTSWTLGLSAGGGLVVSLSETIKVFYNLADFPLHSWIDGHCVHCVQIPLTLFSWDGALLPV